jgi:hypothetical protein
MAVKRRYRKVATSAGVEPRRPRTADRLLELIEGLVKTSRRAQVFRNPFLIHEMRHPIPIGTHKRVRLLRLILAI